jgi:molybdopterin molybdotransferase
MVLYGILQLQTRCIMLTLEQAQAAIIEGIIPVSETEIIDLGQCPGRFLAQTTTAQVANPAFDGSAMDGYAVNISDLQQHEFRLPLQGESYCGLTEKPVLQPASTMRIFTGAPLPEGANAVVIQELIHCEGSDILFPEDVRPGQNIRTMGEDFNIGDVLYVSGHRLHSSDAALLAAAGVPQLEVYRQPRALVVATGDELVAPGQPLQFGQIYESNRQATILMLQQLGVVVDDGGTIADEAGALEAMFDGAADYDFIISSGGVSVGDHDLVKQVFAERGEIRFWKASIKPGKPVAFGRIGERTHFFALPGNPVSSLVTFKLFVEPGLYAWSHSQREYPLLQLKSSNDFKSKPGRRQFLRARMFQEDGGLQVEMLSGQGSHMLRSLSQANCLIQVDEDSSGFSAGDAVKVLPLFVDI